MSEMQDRMVLRGTTTIGVMCKDGVILASDTRVTFGTGFVAHKHGKKVYQIDDHLAMTLSGALADAQWTVDILKANARLYKLNTGRPMPVGSAARLIANLFFSARLAPFIAQILVAGLDATGPHVYSLDPFGSLTEDKCVATGSGSPIAYGVLEDQYKEDMEIKGLLPIIVRALDSAMKRNSFTGDSFDVAVIDAQGYRELSKEEKKTLSA